MKCKAAFLLSGLLIFAVPGFAQEKSTNSDGFFHVSDSAQNFSRIERIGYVCGASLAFSLFDYIGANATKTNTTARSAYRVLEVAVQAGISYFLYKKLGLSSAISFNLIWWTWCDDIAYYGWAYLINPKPPWEGRYFNGMQSDYVSWAGWTPIGLTRKHGSLIDQAVLVTQAMIGFSISIAIL
jgi:hypothetical protein